MNKIVNGQVISLTPEEIQAVNDKEADYLIEKEAADQLYHDNNLEKSCYDYQTNEGGLDSNYYGLIMAIKTLHTVNGTNMPVKAKAVLDWVDALWIDYYSRKGDYTTGLDFSSHGTVPYSFTDVRSESE